MIATTSLAAMLLSPDTSSGISALYHRRPNTRMLPSTASFAAELGAGESTSTRLAPVTLVVVVEPPTVALATRLRPVVDPAVPPAAENVTSHTLPAVVLVSGVLLVLVR